MKYFCFLPLILACCTLLANSDQQALNAAESVIYKETDTRSLKLQLFKPEGWLADQRRPAIVFFFGGGWNNRHITQFVAYAKYYAQQGFVCFIADYRVRSTDDTRVVDSVEDAQDAFAYVRAHAEGFGVDAEKIASAGGSAGGHLAAVLGTVKDLRNDDLSVPNAMILFNPVLVFDPEKSDKWYEKAHFVGTDPLSLSPLHQITSSVPPTIIYHGTADKTVPFASAERFHQAMLKAGLQSTLIPFKGRGHGFFNGGKHLPDSDYKRTLEYTDAFLQEIAWLPFSI